MEVRVQHQNIEKALRDLKKKLQLDGLFGEMKKRRHYEKPSVKKKNKQLEAEKRKRKLLKRARSSGSWQQRPARQSSPAQSPPVSTPQAPAAPSNPART